MKTEQEDRTKYKWQKKPIVIEAVQYIGNNKDEIVEFTKGTAKTHPRFSHLTIPTLEGDHQANIGDWIIKGIKGEFYPIKVDIFFKTYEKVGGK